MVVACIVQRSADIRSDSGCLRSLTQKAKAGEFSLGPILMAQLNTHA
jgi:replication initiation protein RepC